MINSLGIRVGLSALLLLLSQSAAAPATAQTAVAQAPPPSSTVEPSPRIGDTRPAQVCVIVDIAGHKAGHIDCATQALQAAARTAQAQARSGLDVPVVDARSADVRTGVASQSATRQRLGSTFGVSVHPQRPVIAPPPPRGGTVP
ncbi:hypothetical protein [Sphingobium sp. CECT 9361]|uniref:hypothetical protein n=1 Tax=Sphingobium sp. CECT 9361 TaxID=2845384 RepID=UPI001E28B84A|nr:hypothetical protein [Sphingobium sp. CECT 9361]